MFNLRLGEWNALLLTPKRGSSRCPSGKWRLEQLEDRVVLSGPTVYTIDLTSDAAQGSGSSGDIAYVLYFAENNTNPAGSVINFDPSVFDKPQSIELNSTLFLTDAAGPITFDGPGAKLLTITFNLNADGGDGLIDVQPGATVALTRMTISGGPKEQTPDMSTQYAGGINNHGTLTINSCTISQNTGWQVGGGVGNFGILTINDSTITNNDCAGAVYAETVGKGGGGIYNGGSLVLNNTSVSNNDGDLSQFAGGIYNDYLGTLTATACTIDGNTSGSGGGILNLGTETLTDSSISDNNAGSGGEGGGLVNYSVPKSTATTPAGMTILDDCTIAGNTATNGGGILNATGENVEDKQVNVSVLLVVSCTIAYNTVLGEDAFGGGICNGTSTPAFDGVPPATVTLEDTIVALNINTSGSKPYDDDIDSFNTFSPSSAGNLIGTGNDIAL